MSAISAVKGNMTELEKYLNDPSEEDNLFFDCRQDPYPHLNVLGGVKGISGQFYIREHVRQEFCFAVLTEEMVTRIKPYGPILEVGAGTGYWAYEFKKQGMNYLATDAYPGRGNKYFAGAKSWSKVEELTAVEAVRCYPDRTLLMCWPEYCEIWPLEALKEYKGDIFIYIGEEEGGCCADDDFFEYLHSHWDEREELAMPQFFGLHDVAIIYERAPIKMNSRYDLLKAPR